MDIFNFDKLSWNKKIHVLRIVKGWSQVEAASQCITNQKQYWSWESGKNYPREDNRKIIARVYGVKADYIFSDSDKTIDV